MIMTVNVSALLSSLNMRRVMGLMAAGCILLLTVGCETIFPPDRREPDPSDPKPWGGPQQDKDHPTLPGM